MQATEQELCLGDVYGCSDIRAETFEKMAEIEANIEENPALPADVISAVVDRITDLQASIAKHLEIAEADVKPRAAYIEYLQERWKPYIYAYGPQLLDSDKAVTVKLKGAGRIRFFPTGGYYVNDRERLLDHLSTLSDDELAAFGARRTITFESAKVIKHVKETGEVMPGISYIKEDKHGKWKIFATKPWSSRTLLQKLKKAFTSGSMFDEDEAVQD